MYPGSQPYLRVSPGQHNTATSLTQVFREHAAAKEKDYGDEGGLEPKNTNCIIMNYIIDDACHVYQIEPNRGAMEDTLAAYRAGK